MTTEKPINLKSKWNAFAGTGVLIFAVVATFMLTPPLLSLTEETKINWFVKFLITAFVAMFVVPMLARSQKKDYQFWYRVAAMGLLLTLISAVTYTYLTDNWSVPFFNHERLVIGKTMNADVKVVAWDFLKNYNGPYSPMEALVRARQGATANIWPEKELQDRYYILNLVYIITFLASSVFILAVIQSIYCYERET